MSEKNPDEIVHLDAIARRLAGKTGKIFKGEIHPEADAFREDIDTLVRRLPQDAPHGSHGEAYVIELYNEALNFRYVTIVQGGEAQLTLDEEGRIDWDRLAERGLVGENTLGTLVAALLGEEAVPAEAVESPPTKTRRKKSGPSGPSGKKRKRSTGPRPPSTIEYIDPALEAYLHQERAFLSYVLGDNPITRPGKQINKKSEQQRILPSQLSRQAAMGGIQLGSQDVIDLVRSHSGKAIQAREAKRRLLFAYSGMMELVRSLHADMPEGEQRLDYIKAANSGRDIYFSIDRIVEERKFTNLDGNPVQVRVPEIVDLVREFVRAYYESLKGGDEEREDFNAIMRSTLQWVKGAKAADWLRSDHDIPIHVTPAFEQAVGRGSDTAYEGMLNILGKIMDKRLKYRIEKVDFVVSGLTMLGYLTKEDGKARDLKGPSTQYAYPMKNLLIHWDEYDPVLQEAFDNLLRAGEIKNKHFTKRTEDRELADQLYKSMPIQQCRQVFKRSDRDEPLADMFDEDGTRRTHITWVLQMYVGLHREKFNAKISDYHGQ